MHINCSGKDCTMKLGVTRRRIYYECDGKAAIHNELEINEHISSC
jgi:hypothetical protein